MMRDQILRGESCGREDGLWEVIFLSNEFPTFCPAKRSVEVVHAFELLGDVFPRFGARCINVQHALEVLIECGSGWNVCRHANGKRFSLTRGQMRKLRLTGSVPVTDEDGGPNSEDPRDFLKHFYKEPKLRRPALVWSNN